MNIKQLWQKITNIGVDEEHLGRSVIKVRLLNQLMFLTLTTSSLIVISYILTNEGWVIIATTSLNIIIEVFVLSLAYRQRHNAARHFSCILFPTAIAFNVVANGGGFGESNIFLALGFTAFILYEGQKKLQIPAVFYITALFVFSKLYIINYHSTTPNTINPYDEIITFPTILIALGLLIVIYQNEIKRYDKQNKLALKALEIKNNQLAQINSELEQFSYIASHDLKTPLRTITSHLGLIKWHIKKQNFEAIEKDIIFAQNGAKQMYTLISDILEYKQVSNNDEAIQLVNLEEVALQVVQQIDSFIKEKDAIIEIGDDKVINQASIRFLVDETTVDTGYKVPSRMFIQIPDTVDGTVHTNSIPFTDLFDRLSPPTFDWTGYTNYGGDYDASINGYSFRFNRYLQEIVKEYKETGVNKFNGFYLSVPSDFPVVPSRVVMNTDSTAGDVKVSITYTKLD